MKDVVVTVGISILTIGLAILGTGCSDAPEEAPPPTESVTVPLKVRAVNYPLSYFAERIGGDRVDATFVIPPAVDPAFWQPTPAEIAEFQSAELVLLNGAGYASWVGTATLASSKLVDTSQAFASRLLEGEETRTHTHGPEGDHSHAPTATTTWLDLELASAQAQAVFDALAAARPLDGASFQDRLAGLQTELAALDERLTETGRRLGATPLLASHPVYQYLAKRYGLDICAVHFEPDEAPTEDGWQELRGVHADHPASWMLWESEPLPETRDRLREMGVESLVYDPCGGSPAGGDWLDVMRGNVERLEQVRSSKG